MKRFVLFSLALAALLAAPALAETRIQVNIGLAPPPPVVVFREPPPMAFVPEARVYYVDREDLPYDCFRFGVYFYIYNDGWWYRASRYGGPYRVIEERRVPQAIMMVPTRHWKHHPHGMPPGQAKKYYGDERGRGRGQSNGHGHDRH